MIKLKKKCSKGKKEQQIWTYADRGPELFNC